jgi:hypothetical protein
MGNKEILQAVESMLRRQTRYGLSVEFDSEGNPTMKVAPVFQATEDPTKNSPSAPKQKC